MDFKTKRKIVIMKRKFNHTDLAMIGGAITLLGSIAFMLVTQGISS
jgi:hypothetical protein